MRACVYVGQASMVVGSVHVSAHAHIGFHRVTWNREGKVQRTHPFNEVVTFHQRTFRPCSVRLAAVPPQPGWQRQ